MSHLVTQVNEKDDPVKLAELAKLQAQQLAQQKKERTRDDNGIFFNTIGDRYQR